MANDGREQNDVVSTISSLHAQCLINFLLFIVCFGCSFSMAMVNFGGEIEKSHWWPQLKHYFHMADWILNYRAGVTTQPANCKFSFFGLEWKIIPLVSILMRIYTQWCFLCFSHSIINMTGAPKYIALLKTFEFYINIYVLINNYNYYIIDR